MPSSTLANTNPILPFFPAYAFSASPTWFIWVKLTCASIHHDLRTRADFPANLIDAPPSGTGHAKPLLLFYLNHPIQFVQVVGIVVAIEDFHEHFFLLTIDDSSGSTIDVISWKPRPKPPTTVAREDSQNGYGDALTSSLQSKDASLDSTNILALLATLHIGTCVVAKGTITSSSAAHVNFPSCASLTSPPQQPNLASYPLAQPSSTQCSASHGNSQSPSWIGFAQSRGRQRER